MNNDDNKLICIIYNIIIYTSELNKPIYYMYDNKNQLNNEIFN